MIRIRLLLALTALLLATTGCSVNQVTGERQLSMPMSEQIALGSKQYMPAQQQQGGVTLSTQTSMYTSIELVKP